MPRAQVLLQAGWKGGVFWPVHSWLRSSSTTATNDGALLLIPSDEWPGRRGGLFRATQFLADLWTVGIPTTVGPEASNLNVGPEAPEVASPMDFGQGSAF